MTRRRGAGRATSLRPGRNDATDGRGRSPTGHRAERNRYVDLMRLVAILVVVAGHWLNTIVLVDEGHAVGVSALAAVGYMRWLTLLLQVMPMFFLAGGYAAAAAWPSWQARGARWSGWTRVRLERLLRPTTWYLAIVVCATAVALLLGVPPETVARAGWAVAFQLWFLPVYMLLILLAPPMIAAWHRGGWSALALALALVATVDVLVRVGEARTAAWANYLLAPGAGFLLGVAWHAGAVTRRAAWALLVGGAASLVVLVGALGYPPWMVGVPGEPTSNTSPPNLALAAYSALQIGAVLLLEPATRRWLARPRPWAAVVRGNSALMTLYLWHMVPVVLLAVIIVAADIPTGPTAGSLGWWGLRVVWIATLAALLAPLVAVVGRFERGGAGSAAGNGTAGTASSRALPVLILTCAGLTGGALSRLAVGGLAPGGHLAVWPLAGYALGVLALRLGARISPRRTQAATRQR